MNNWKLKQKIYIIYNSIKNMKNLRINLEEDMKDLDLKKNNIEK